MPARLRRPLALIFVLLAALALVAGFGHTRVEGAPAARAVVVADLDGNVYPLVRIGQQEWLGENLRTTRLTDGAPVPGLFTYDSDERAVLEHGRLYTWDATQRGLCPEGLRVPSDADWDALERALGMEDSTRATTGWRRTGDEAVQLKAWDEVWRWERDRAARLDSSGFGARASGVRSPDGRWVGRGTYADWWSSTVATIDGRAFNRSLVWMPLHPGRSKVFRNIIDARWAFSIRCVREAQSP